MSIEFSFIIATHNEDPRIVAATVNGLRRQFDRYEAEIILVDDHSDLAVRVVNEETVKHEKVIRLGCRFGIAAARNEGVQHARGRTLIFTDAHVAFSSNILDVLRSSGVAEGDGIRGCETAILHHVDDLKFAADGGRPFSTCFLAQYLAWKLDLTGFPKVVPISAGSPVDDTWENVPYVGGCCYAISRALFDDLGGFAECLVGIGNGGDLELAIRCHAVGLPVRSTRSATCYHLTENRKHSIDYSDPLSGLDLDRYPGSTTNILRTVARYLTPLSDLRISPSLNLEQLRHLNQWDTGEFARRVDSIRARITVTGQRLRDTMTAGEPL